MHGLLQNKVSAVLVLTHGMPWQVLPVNILGNGDERRRIPLRHQRHSNQLVPDVAESRHCSVDIRMCIRNTGARHRVHIPLLSRGQVSEALKLTESRLIQALSIGHLAASRSCSYCFDLRLHRCDVLLLRDGQ